MLQLSVLLQAMGDNVAELIFQFGMDLSSGNDVVEEDEKLIFFDVLGLFMVGPQSVVQLLQGVSHPAWQRSQWQMPILELFFILYLLPRCHAHYAPCSTGDILHEPSQDPPQDSTSAGSTNAARYLCFEPKAAA